MVLSRLCVGLLDRRSGRCSLFTQQYVQGAHRTSSLLQASGHSIYYLLPSPSSECRTSLKPISKQAGGLLDYCFIHTTHQKMGCGDALFSSRQAHAPPYVHVEPNKYASSTHKHLSESDCLQGQGITKATEHAMARRPSTRWRAHHQKSLTAAHKPGGGASHA